MERAQVEAGWSTHNSQPVSYLFESAAALVHLWCPLHQDVIFIEYVVPEAANHVDRGLVTRLLYLGTEVGHCDLFQEA